MWLLPVGFYLYAPRHRHIPDELIQETDTVRSITLGIRVVCIHEVYVRLADPLIQSSGTSNDLRRIGQSLL